MLCFLPWPWTKGQGQVVPIAWGQGRGWSWDSCFCWCITTSLSGMSMGWTVFIRNAFKILTFKERSPLSVFLTSKSQQTSSWMLHRAYFLYSYVTKMLSNYAYEFLLNFFVWVLLYLWELTTKDLRLNWHNILKGDCCTGTDYKHSTFKYFLKMVLCKKKSYKWNSEDILVHLLQRYENVSVTEKLASYMTKWTSSNAQPMGWKQPHYTL